MLKHIQIGGDGRTGGSLLARLLDTPPRNLSFPIEQEFFANRNGELFDIQQAIENQDYSAILETEMVAKLVKFGKGKLVSKKIYDRGTISFDYNKFLTILEGRLTNQWEDASLESIYNEVTHCFFEVLYNRSIQPDTVVNHCSRTFLADLKGTFTHFRDFYFIHTLRDLLSFSASMKNYQFIVTGLNKDEVGEDFLKMLIDRWLLSTWHALKNKIEFGKRYILLHYEALVRDPQSNLRKLCQLVDLPFTEEILVPTIVGESWSGNSSFGKKSVGVSSSSLRKYQDVFSSSELEYLQNHVPEEILEIENLNFKENVESEWDNLNAFLNYRFKEDFDEFASREYFNRLHMEITDLQLG